MTYNPDIHNRKSIRLKNYDYSREGLYFITICSHNKECIFGEIIEGMDVIDKIASVPTITPDRPIKNIRMKIKLLN